MRQLRRLEKISVNDIHTKQDLDTHMCMSSSNWTPLWLQNACLW